MSEFRTKLTKGFDLIRKRGYFARQRWQCCQSCGCAALPDGITNYIFYHAQDAEALKEAEDLLMHGSYSSRFDTDTKKAQDRVGVMLAWGGNGQAIQKAFLEVGLAVTWDGSTNTRIWVSLPLQEVVISEDQVYREQIDAFIGTLH